MPHAAHEHEAKLAPRRPTPQALEDQKVAGAIKTDFILSAEIMAIALAAIPVERLLDPAPSCWRWSASRITAGVYGAVALIVKADDIGVALARNAAPAPLGRLSRAIGRRAGARHAGLPAGAGAWSAPPR